MRCYNISLSEGGANDGPSAEGPWKACCSPDWLNNPPRVTDDEQRPTEAEREGDWKTHGVRQTERGRGRDTYQGERCSDTHRNSLTGTGRQEESEGWRAGQTHWTKQTDTDKDIIGCIPLEGVAISLVWFFSASQEQLHLKNYRPLQPLSYPKPQRIKRERWDPCSSFPTLPGTAESREGVYVRPWPWLCIPHFTWNVMQWPFPSSQKCLSVCCKATNLVAMLQPKQMGIAKSRLGWGRRCPTWGPRTAAFIVNIPGKWEQLEHEPLVT